MDQALNSQKTPHTSPLRASYGMSFVSILMKNDRVIKGFYCMTNGCFYVCSRGNFVLVGPIGAHLATLCQLALHVADIPIHKVDTAKENTFLDGLRSAVRLTGAEGKTLTLLFTAVSWISL